MGFTFVSGQRPTPNRQGRIATAPEWARQLTAADLKLLRGQTAYSEQVPDPVAAPLRQWFDGAWTSGRARFTCTVAPTWTAGLPAVPGPPPLLPPGPTRGRRSLSAPRRPCGRRRIAQGLPLSPRPCGGATGNPRTGNPW